MEEGSGGGRGKGRGAGRRNGEGGEPPLRTPQVGDRERVWGGEQQVRGGGGVEQGRSERIVLRHPGT